MPAARKRVTVLFADVAGSTALGERFEPEAVRGALSSWFEVAKAVIESHGGTVEKFIGDAVMAVFGVPRLHEDDAIRAVYAADSLRTELVALNGELERDRGLALRVRIGVNTGEVVVGDGNTLVTGDVVNVAKRLEEAAALGDVMVGEATCKLVGGAASFDSFEPVVAKGKSEPVRAARLLSVDRDDPDRRSLNTPLVGRQPELAMLRRAFQRAVDEQTCISFTLLGVAGIGKSRLSQELFDEARSEATILVGRCLPYGDGITFWPLVQVLRDIGADAIGDLLGDSEEAALVRERLAGITGRGAVASHHTFWAARIVLGSLARRQPLILCFEDVHWAEPTFLDFVEYLAAWTHDAPILVLCLARTEFLDDRPAWLAGHRNAETMTLTALSRQEAESLLGTVGLAGELLSRVVEASEGNPLYAEQMAAMVTESEGATSLAGIPPTIEALLAARLDRLAPDERTVVETASVCGKEFWRDAVVDLCGAGMEERIGPALMSLARKDLIRPHRSTSRTDDAYQFGHVLIRDAAYAGASKEARASLHEQFADWLGSTAGAQPIELEEVIGYHLEQAFGYRQQLGPIGPHAQQLANRAGILLGEAGERAFARSDLPAAANLLERASGLLGELPDVRLQVLASFGSALMAMGEFARAEPVLEEALLTAAKIGDKRIEVRVAIDREFLRAFTRPESSTAQLIRVAEHAFPVLEELGDDLGLAKAWWLRSEADVIAGRWATRAEALERARTHARAAGDRRIEVSVTAQLADAFQWGPMPVPEAIRRCQQLKADIADEPVVDAAMDSALAVLRAMEGKFDEARAHYRRAQQLYDELGLHYMRAVRRLSSASVELLALDVEAGVRELRSGYDALEQMGEQGARSTLAAFLAKALVVAGRWEEASLFADASRQTGSTADIVTQAVWRSASAHCLAVAGNFQSAEPLALEAVELADSTDFLEIQADTRLELASVLGLAGHPNAVQALVEGAYERHRQKGNSVAAKRAAAMFDAGSRDEGAIQPNERSTHAV